MKMGEFNLEDKFYTADDYKLGRWVLKEIVNRKTADGDIVEYIAEDITGRKQKVKPADVFFDIEEAKKVALANWEIIYAQVKESIANFTDASFDSLQQQYKEREEAKAQK
jgi:hypothetical protein